MKVPITKQIFIIFLCNMKIWSFTKKRPHRSCKNVSLLNLPLTWAIHSRYYQQSNSHFEIFHSSVSTKWLGTGESEDRHTPQHDNINTTHQPLAFADSYLKNLQLHWLRCKTYVTAPPSFYHGKDACVKRKDLPI